MWVTLLMMTVRFVWGRETVQFSLQGETHPNLCLALYNVLSVIVALQETSITCLNRKAVSPISPKKSVHFLMLNISKISRPFFCKLGIVSPKYTIHRSNIKLIPCWAEISALYGSI